MGVYQMIFQWYQVFPRALYLLFLLYINDISDNILNAKCRLYADDTLLAMDLSNSSPSALQKNVDALGDWADRWCMKFNPSKCVHMCVGLGTTPTFALLLNGQEIPRSDSVKYLGVHIHNC